MSTGMPSGNDNGSKRLLPRRSELVTSPAQQPSLSFRYAYAAPLTIRRRRSYARPMSRCRIKWFLSPPAEIFAAKQPIYGAYRYLRDTQTRRQVTPLEEECWLTTPTPAADCREERRRMMLTRRVTPPPEAARRHRIGRCRVASPLRQPSFAPPRHVIE